MVFVNVVFLCTLLDKHVVTPSSSIIKKLFLHCTNIAPEVLYVIRSMRLKGVCALQRSSHSGSRWLMMPVRLFSESVPERQ